MPSQRYKCMGVYVCVYVCASVCVCSACLYVCCLDEIVGSVNCRAINESTVHHREGGEGERDVVKEGKRRRSCV